MFPNSGLMISEKCEAIFRDELNDVSHLYDDYSILKEKLNELQFLPEGLLHRLRSWIKHINTYFPYNQSSYIEMIKVVIDAANENDLFVQQTPVEFETSKYFLVQFWTLTKEKQNVRGNPKSLLSLSLIYGKYPGMVKCSFREAVNKYYHHYNEPETEFFITMFERFPIPKIFLNNFSSLTGTELDCIMFITYGRNIRHFDKLPYLVSRKESFIINKISSNFDFNDQILKKIIICAKLYYDTPNIDWLLSHFVTGCRDFNFPIDPFYRKIDFWKSAFYLICENIDVDDIVEVLIFVDYFLYMSNNNEETYSLKGRTYKSIKRAVDEWHSKIAFEKMTADMEKTWKGKGMESRYYDSKKISIREITTAKELLNESIEMKNCVFTYIDSCIQGYSSIWQMQKLEGNIYSSIVTIEVRENEIIQASGSKNSPLEKDEEKWLIEWAYDVGFFCDFLN